MQTIQIHSGLVCSWTPSQALVIDSLSGDRISSFSVTSAFSPSQNQETASSPQIIYVGASPPYAFPPKNDKKKRAASFASPSANFSAVLMILVKIQEESSSLSAVFVAAETGELLGSMRVPFSHSNNATVVHAAVAPVFSPKYKRHRTLFACNKLAWVIQTSTGSLEVGVFDKKANKISNVNSQLRGSRNLTSAEQEQEDNDQHLIGADEDESSSSDEDNLSSSAKKHHSTSSTLVKDGNCIAFAFSVDLESKQTLLHFLEKTQGTTHEVLLKEHSFEYANLFGQNESPFKFSWASQPLTKESCDILLSNKNNNNNTEKTFLLTDSREAMRGQLKCYAVNSTGVVAVVLTPESTASYQWTFNSNNKSSSTTTNTKTQKTKKEHGTSPISSVSDARLIQKPRPSGSSHSNSKLSPCSVGILIASNESNKVGVCWIDYSSSSESIPNQTLDESWTSKISSSSMSTSLFVSPITGSPYEILSSSSSGNDIFVNQIFLTNFDHHEQQRHYALHTDLVALSSSSSQEEKSSSTSFSLVLDTTDINAETTGDPTLNFFSADQELTHSWTVTRDLASFVVAAAEEPSSASAASASASVIVSVRICTDANRAEMDLAKWIRWSLYGYLLSKVASIKPDRLFLILHQQQQSSFFSSSRWPAPALRIALRTLGGDVIKGLAVGLLKNFYLVAASGSATSDKTAAQTNNKSFTFALSCAVKVIESCVTMQRSLGVNFDDVVEPFTKKLEDLERSWAGTGTIGHRVASISSLTMMIKMQQQSGGSATSSATGLRAKALGTSVAGATTTAASTQLYFDTKVGEDSQMNSSVSTSTMDQVCSVVGALKKQLNVPSDLF